jgi:hypothetical protein
MNLRRLFFVVNIIAVVALLLQGSAISAGQGATVTILEGKFIILWGDSQQGRSEMFMEYFLATTRGETVGLVVSEGLLSPLGGGLGLNRQSVVVQGAWLEGYRIFQVQAISLANDAQANPQGVYGSQPWVSILCKFADVTDEPRDKPYFVGMYSDQYPGLDHFWRQNSYDLANLEGSGVAGWYVLPHNRDYYVYGGHLDFGRAAQDCSGVADPYLDFTPFVGINLMFNAELDNYAWGGGWYLCLDGICKVWRMTWEPPWGYENIGVIAHETGHGFSLPHSEGNCHQTYDNRWDVMSDVWDNGEDPLYGTMGQHTISYHKELLGWITSEQVFTATLGTLATISLEKLALPQTENYLGAVIPIDGSLSHFYTLEVRKPTADPVDYDKWLPGFAVIIHEVTVGNDEPAVVIDQDGDCDTGDAGAMYIPGEVFTDEAHGIQVEIDSSTDSGYVVTINNHFVAMQQVEISGAMQGNAGESLPFSATVSPENATTPITYTWEATGIPPVEHVGGTTDNIELAWEEVGTKAITLTASNAGGSVVDTHLVEIQNAIPLVSLEGPGAGNVGESYIYTATVLPEDVLQPITFTWQASGQELITHTGGLSDAVRFTWYMPGWQVITVTATNAFGSTSITKEVKIWKPPQGVELSGPVEGFTYRDYTFTATVDPADTTIPITYTWSIDGGEGITHVGGISDELVTSWERVGTYTISVTATNPAGSVAEIWTISILARILIPITMKN